MSTNDSTCDSDYEEEEILVFADFKNNILNELEAGNPLIKIIGIDSENPIAEVNGNIFKGKLMIKSPINSKMHWTQKHIILSGVVDPFTKEENMISQWELMLYSKKTTIHHL